MTTITKQYPSKQYLESVISSGDFAQSVPPEIVMVMARALLASMGAQEPVAWISERNLKNLGKSFSVYVKHEPVMVRPIPLYAAPQPAPVVPDEKCDDDGSTTSEFDHGWNACRAAMLQAGNSPVQDGWVACSERMPNEDGNYWGWWSESKRQGPVWFIKSELQAQFQSAEITHWMPLPAAPKQE